MTRIEELDVELKALETDLRNATHNSAENQKKLAALASKFQKVKQGQDALAMRLLSLQGLVHAKRAEIKELSQGEPIPEQEEPDDAGTGEVESKQSLSEKDDSGPGAVDTEIF